MTSGRAVSCDAAVYPLAAEGDGPRALESLEACFATLREASPVCHRVYLDTFDWRLHRQGLRLCSRGIEKGATILELVSEGDRCEGDRLECRLANGTLPAFAADVPAGTMHARIAPLIESRRLLPLASLETTGQTLRVLDDQEKTVARVVVERTAVTTPENGESVAQLPPILRLEPLRGYPAAARRVARHLEDRVGLAAGDWQPFTDALEAVGRSPGAYGTRPAIKLSGDMRAGQAVAAVCRRLLDNMVANEDGMRRDLDVEFLHDFRVGVRRTRSALAQLKHVIAPEAARRFRREFKWLGSVTGAVRDLDVYLLKMDEYRNNLPADAAEDLAPLDEFLRRRRRTERRRMLAALRTRRYRNLVGDWRAFVDGDIAGDSPPVDSASTVEEVATDRIRRAYRRIERDGRKTNSDTPAEVLHELRIDCKKLRYLLEFFYSLYDEDDIAPLLKTLKRLQDNLGDFNDLDVQQRTLQQFAHQMEDEELASVDCLLAMGRLLDHLLHRQAAERKRFKTCFSRFSAPENKKRFKRLFEQSRQASA
jgi:CHAD domain-containing protein